MDASLSRVLDATIHPNSIHLNSFSWIPRCRLLESILPLSIQFIPLDATSCRVHIRSHDVVVCICPCNVCLSSSSVMHAHVLWCHADVNGLPWTP